MPIPSGTYRIQLNKDFNLTDLKAIVGYLHELGVSTVYASPLSTAVKGSLHGYDVTDPLTLNPEIGSEQQLQELAALLQCYGMSWLQDIVPNHMGYSSANPWLCDVLERGRDSAYYTWFDTMTGGFDTMTGGADTMTGGSDSTPDGRLMAPFLGSTLSECLEKKELRLQYSPSGFIICYYDNHYPVAAHLYRWICTVTGGYAAGWLSALDQLEKALDADEGAWRAAKQLWLGLIECDPERKEFITRCVNHINGHPLMLASLLDNQHYQLTHARLADTHINYRRFFTINGLICLRMDRQEVFEGWHQTLRHWYTQGWINGLRVDHIDGLADPKRYLQRLRRLFGPDCYVVAEKILTGEETMPEDWPLDGTTGYDFLGAVNQLLCDAGGSRQLLTFYKERIIDLSDYDTVIYERKLNFLYKYMAGELGHLLGLLTSPLLPTQPAGRERLKQALSVWMASFPVYRAYPDEQGGSPSDRGIFLRSLAAAREKRPDLLPELDRLAGLCDYDQTPLGHQRLHFLRRLMQFTGPLAAKGIEDTTFYVYNPYISHCEVGDSPAVAGMTAEVFHRRMKDRQAHWRHSLNATTTHDTKRGEDSRVRLSFLSAMPREWITAVTEWRRLNSQHILAVGGKPAPSPNDEYLIYQSLLGGFPEDGIVTDRFRERCSAWLVKALREAKTETNYEQPDEAYEGQCQAFLSALLAPVSPFLAVFIPFALDIIRRCSVFSLSQLLLKLTAPGIPDIYQGAELGELSFVDPDNRRPVDFQVRRSLLRKIKEAEAVGSAALLDLLRRHRREGIERLFTVYRALGCRRALPQLFADGEYIPVPCEGPLLAYLRHYGHDWALVAVPLIRCPDPSLPAKTLTLPPGTPGIWTDVFTGARVRVDPSKPYRPKGPGTWPVLLMTGRDD